MDDLTTRYEVANFGVPAGLRPWGKQQQLFRGAPHGAFRI